MNEIIEKIKNHQKVLIEASAGTGKTYMLENMILNLMKCKLYTTSEILVLTFTNKATKEMHARILKTIYDAYIESKLNENLKEIYEQSSKMFISTIHEFALYALNNFQIETNNFYKYEAKDNFSKEIDEIVYEFLRKSNTLIQTFDIKDYEFELFKSESKTTEKIIEKIKKAYRRDKTNELETWLKQQKEYETVLKKREELIKKYNNIIENLNKMTIDEITTFYKKYPYTNKDLPRIDFKKEDSLFKIADILLNSKLFSTLINKEIKKNATLSYEEIKIKEALIDLSISIKHEAYISEEYNSKKARNNLKTYVIFKVEYKILKYIEEELKKIIKLTNTIDQSHIISNFKKHLESENTNLLIAIKNRYKIILIDEAQDLDVTQIQIFKLLQKVGIKLVFISDPKQIIYSFRNSDIYFYNKEIKNKINKDAKIILKVNFRSIKKIIEPLNTIFENIYNAHGINEIEKIEFTESNSSSKNDNNNIFINEKEIKGINIIKLNNEKEKKTTECIYKKTALTIKYLMANGKIVDNNGISRNIKEKDIKVICRKQKEVNLIDQALKNEQIKTTKTEKKFLNTKEFSEILYILKCLDRNQSFKNLSTILNSNIINLPWDLQRILLEKDKINIVEEFIENIITSLERNEITLIAAINKIVYEKNLWIKIAEDCKDQKLIKIIKNKITYKSLLIKENKFENLRNYELVLDYISNIYYEEKNIQSLLLALEELIINEEIEEIENKENESQNEAIELMTIHKSKGLSINIVFLINTMKLNNSLRLDDFYKFYKNEKIEYDFFKLDENKKLARLKIISEEKNLFYVGTTRAKYALFIVKTDSITSELLKLSKVVSIDTIEQDFNVYELFKQNKLNEIEIKTNEIKLITPNTINKNLFQKDFISSFSSLAVKYKHLLHQKNNNLKDKSEYEKDIDTNFSLEETLPIGKDIGNILHSAMAEITFSTAKDTFENFKSNNIEIIEKQIKKFNLNFNTKEIQETLSKMIYNTLNCNIKPINTKLCEIEELQKEMEFLLKIDLKDQTQNYLFNNSSEKSFIKNNNGYLKGIIDLIIKINNKIYILDYKTNYLGKYQYDYKIENLKHIMKEEYYDLQYKIYTLGIKKILFKDRKNYESNFGGVIYLFTRAFKNNIEYSSPKVDHGIYFDLPKFDEDLDLYKIMEAVNSKRQL